MAGIERGMLVLLARGGLPGLWVGWNTLMAPSSTARGDPSGLTWCWDGGRPGSSAAVAVAGAAAAVPPSRPRQAPASSAPRRWHSTAACERSSSAHRSRPRPARCVAARPARAQLVAAGRSWASRLQRSTRHRAGAARSGQRVSPNLLQVAERRLRGAVGSRVRFAGCCRRIAGSHSDDTRRNAIPAWALQRHLASAGAAGRGRMPSRWEVRRCGGRVW